MTEDVSSSTPKPYPYSEKALELFADPYYKEALAEVMMEYGKYTNKCRDIREEMAKKEGISYKEYIEQTEKALRSAAQGIRECIAAKSASPA